MAWGYATPVNANAISHWRLNRITRPACLRTLSPTTLIQPGGLFRGPCLKGQMGTAEVRNLNIARAPALCIHMDLHQKSSDVQNGESFTATRYAGGDEKPPQRRDGSCILYGCLSTVACHSHQNLLMLCTAAAWPSKTAWTSTFCFTAYGLAVNTPPPTNAAVYCNQFAAGRCATGGRKAPAVRGPLFTPWTRTRDGTAS